MSSSFREISGFEFRLHARRPSTWIYFALLFVVCMFFTAIMEDNTAINLNAPVAIAQYTFFIGFMGILVTAAFFGDAASRDLQSRVQPLFFTTPITKLDYLGGRFLGALAINVLVLLAAPSGLAVQYLLQDPQLLGPFRPASYVQPFAVFLLPGLLVNGSILFAMSALSRRAVPVYIGAFGLFLAYGIGISLFDLMDDRTIAAIIDPSGLVAAATIIGDWTPAQQNERLLPLDGLLLWNRLFWIGIAGAVLVYTYSRFRFSVRGTHDKRGKFSVAAETDEGVVRTPHLVVPPVTQEFGPSARVRQVLSVAQRGFREIMLGRDFLAVLAGLVLLFLMLAIEGLSDRYGTGRWPTTSGVAVVFASTAAKLLLVFVIAFFSGELVWRERDTGLSDIADAVPLPDWVLFCGKLLALGVMLVMIQAVMMLTGIVLQASMGYFDFEPLLYVQILFGLQLPSYMMLATVALLVHVLVNHKYLANLVVLLIVAGFGAARFAGIEHNLLVFGSVPQVVHSDMTGFGPFLKPVLWFTLYWLAWTVLLAFAAVFFWVRGRETDVRRRMVLARRRLNRRAVAATGVAAGVTAALGGFVFYNTNIVNDYRNSTAEEAGLAEYERRYEKYATAPPLEISRVGLRLEIHPETPRLDLRGTYTLVNRNAVPVRAVHLSTSDVFSTESLTFDRPSRVVVADDVYGFRVYDLGAAVAPGDSVRMVFVLRAQQRGFENVPRVTTVTSNGTFVDRRRLPVMGYQRDRELQDPDVRRAHGLGNRPPSAAAPDREPLAGMNADEASGRIVFDAVIGTSRSETAVAPGRLEREWTENGRRYFHYRSEAPMADSYAILSGRYAVRDEQSDGVQLQVFHHPGHSENVARIATAAKTAIAYFASNFGAYPHDVLRIAEFPRYSGASRSYPTLIAHSEATAFMTRVKDSSGDTDTPLLMTAQEVARQWWGNGVVNSTDPESRKLFDLLTHYSAIMVMEKVHDRERVHQYLRQMLIEYLNRRARGDAPLLELGKTQVTHSRKGPVVMYALRHRLGEEPLNAALSRLVEQHRAGMLPDPSFAGFYRELQALTADSLQYVLDDYLRDITIWPARLWKVTSEPAANGDYRVTIELEAAKLKVDSAGREIAVPMNEPVEIAVYGTPRGTTLSEERLYLARHMIRSGRQAIVVNVPGKPIRAAMDPYRLLIDRRGDDLSDNVRAVDSQ